jgi:hypothetical protein
MMNEKRINDSSNFEADDPDEPQPQRQLGMACPFCNVENVFYIGNCAGWTPGSGPTFHCYSCGKEWQLDEGEGESKHADFTH